MGYRLVVEGLRDFGEYRLGVQGFRAEFWGISLNLH